MTETSTDKQPVTDMWNPKFPFPKNRYVLRCLNKEFKTSKSSGNPMIELEWEIVCDGNGAQTKSIAISAKERKEMVIAGAKLRSWLTLTDANMGNVRDFHNKLGIETGEIDQSSPDLSHYENLVINAIVYSKLSEELSDDINPVTGKQIPIKDDNGKPIQKNFLTLGDVISRNTSEVAAA